MSESDTGPDVPSDARIRSALKDWISSTYKSGAHDDLTLKRVRGAVEEQLGLPGGWFKEHQTWNATSKTFITGEVQRVMEEQEEEDNDEAAQDAAEEDAKPTKKPMSRANGVAGRKRKSDEAKPKARPKPKPRKKRKVDDEEEEGGDGEVANDAQGGESAEDSPKPAVTRTAQRKQPRSSKAKRVVSEDDSEVETAAGQAPQIPEPDRANVSEAEASPQMRSPAVKAPLADGSDSESSLSSLLDEAPPKSRGRKTAGAAAKSKSKPKPETKAKAKAAKKAAAEPSPDDEEIKKLQSWLLKCGIRKVWGRELKAFPTAREKIKHLRGLLSAAGMSGRFSVEKARQIKEARELAADLEAVTEYDERWGSREEEATGKTRASLAQSLGLEGLLDSASEDE